METWRDISHIIFIVADKVKQRAADWSGIWEIINSSRSEEEQELFILQSVQLQKEGDDFST